MENCLFNYLFIYKQIDCQSWSVNTKLIGEKFLVYIKYGNFGEVLYVFLSTSATRTSKKYIFKNYLRWWCAWYFEF